MGPEILIASLRVGTSIEQMISDKAQNHTFFLQADLQNFAGRGFENMTLQVGVWTLQAGLWPACKVTCTKKTIWWPEGPPNGVVAAPKALLLNTFFQVR